MRERRTACAHGHRCQQDHAGCGDRRNFAKATGRPTKTDVLDAGVIAQFAAVAEPTLRRLPDAATRELAGRLVRAEIREHLR